MKIDALKRFRGWVAAALTMAIMTVVAVPAIAAPNRRAENVGGPEQRSNATSKGVQVAVRALARMLRSPAIEKVLEYVRSAGKKDIARVISKHSSTIASTLESIAELDYLTVAFARDKVMQALRAVGVSRETADITGFWIEQVLGWVP